MFFPGVSQQKAVSNQFPTDALGRGRRAEGTGASGGVEGDGAPIAAAGRLGKDWISLVLFVGLF